MVNQTLIQRDLKHIWHPCMQMKDFEIEPPFVVKEARGCYLYTDRGPLIDANASWWCKSLGHNHPDIIAAISKQLHRFEHVIAANSTHPLLVELGEALSDISGLQHAFFASDGSCAVEIAMKLAIHANVIRGRHQKKSFAALKGAYHGETMATLAVSDLGIYKEAYKDFSLPCHFIEPIPYVHSSLDPLWSDASEAWSKAETFLSPLSGELCAILVEPIVQGAGGMKLYSADFLKRLANWAKAHDIYLIADEIMSGCGRTGRWLASEYAGCQPDMVCLSKGLTSGTLAFSTVMVDDAIYELFYDDYHKGKSFLHSHTYSGNALGASAALATIHHIKNHEILEQSQGLSQLMKASFEYIAEKTQVITNIRQIGAVVAAEFDFETQAIDRPGFQLYRKALANGAFLRPLGNTIYWTPPLIINETIIGKLTEITLKSIEEVKNGILHA